MGFTYSEEALKIAIAQLAHNVGWHGIGSNSFELLIDVTARFMREIGKTSNCIANQYNRTQVNFDDVQLAFDYLGVSVNELEDYYKQVDAIPFVKGRLAKYPVEQRTVKRINYPDSNELEARAEYYEEWLPSIKLNTESDNLLNSKVGKDTQADNDALNGVELDDEEMDRRYINSLKSQVGPNEKIGGFTELTALVPNYIYLSDAGKAMSFGCREGKVPESKLPPLTAEDRERIQQEEERMKQELEKEREKPQPLLKIKIKEKYKKYFKGDFRTKELLKRAKKEKKLKPKFILKKMRHPEVDSDKVTEGDALKEKEDLLLAAEKLGLSNEANEIKRFSKLKERTQKEKKVKVLKEADLEKLKRKRERQRKKQEELERKQRLRDERKARKEAREREKEEKRKARERKRLEKALEKENKSRKPRSSKKNNSSNLSKDEIEDSNSNFSMNSSQTNSIKLNTSTNSNPNERDEKEAASILVSLSEDNKKSNKKITKKRAQKETSKELIDTSSSSSSSSSSEDEKVDEDDEEESCKDDAPDSPTSSISSIESDEEFKMTKSNNSKKKNSMIKKDDHKQSNGKKSSESNKETTQPPPPQQTTSSPPPPPPPVKPAFKSLAERKAMPPEIKETSQSTAKKLVNTDQTTKKMTKFKKRKLNDTKDDSGLDVLFKPTFTLPSIKKKVQPKPKKKFNDDYIDSSSCSNSSDESSEDERALISKKKDVKKKKKMKDDPSMARLTVKLPSRTNSPTPSLKSSKKEKVKDLKKEDKKSKKELAIVDNEKTSSKSKEKKDESIKESKKLEKSISAKTSKTTNPAVEPVAVENKPKKKAKVIITPTKAARKEAQEKGCVLVTQTVSTNEAEKVWYCPTCSKPDDGSSMIGCDNCDSWFHWSCVGITENPTEDSWFCAACVHKQQQIELKFKKKRKPDDQEASSMPKSHPNSVGRPSKASLSNDSSVKSHDSQKNSETKKSNKKDSVSKATTSVESDLNQDVWICPGCNGPDDGTKMIGCDGPCDSWWHFSCCDLVVEPKEDEKWFCLSCKKTKEPLAHKHKKQKKS